MTDPQEPKRRIVKESSVIVSGISGIGAVIFAPFLDSFSEKAFMTIIGILIMIYAVIMIEFAEIKQMMRGQQDD